MAASPENDKVRIVCISDTHNDDCTDSLPEGDILIHSGDMTDDGTMEELQAAYNWITALPHKIKIVISGNHDMGLDPAHKSFLPAALDLFTSPAARASGLYYLDRRVHQVPIPPPSSSTITTTTTTVNIYANPHQPEFLGKPYAFIYPPYPSLESVSAWSDAPTAPGDDVPIWITHGPAQGRLDWIPIPPLVGCAVQAAAIAKAKPVLTVFGHYHISHGVEVVTWGDGEGGQEQTETLARAGEPAHFDFTTPERRFERGEKTIFVNAAWMTIKKPRDGERYMPVVVDLPVDLLVS